MKQKSYFLLLFFFVLILLPKASNAQITLQDAGDCLNSGDTWSLAGSVAGHNTYQTNLLTSGLSARIMWSVDRNRWEILADLDFNGVYSVNEVLHYNTTNTTPNPPALGLGTWVSVFGCSNIIQFNGQSTSTTLPVAITANPANQAVCIAANTTFTVTAANADSYQWQVNNGSGFASMINAGIYSGATTTTLTITGATAGMNGYVYRAIATGSGSGSVTSTAATLTVSNMSSAYAKSDVTCFGNNNGAAAVSVSGGIAPYTYSWSPSGGTGTVATGLTAGNYTVTITDNIGCQITRNFTINQPASVISGTTVVTNVSCFGGTDGTINLTPTGGTGPYTYNWGGGITTEDRTRLMPGNYSVTITDANGCTGIVNTTVTQAAAFSATATVTNVTCYNGSSGAINLNITGASPPYTYNWGDGATTKDRTGLTAGIYRVTISDVIGCQAIFTNITVTQPIAPVSGTRVITNVSCNNGSNGTINLTPTGGIGPYTYDWGGGVTTEDRTGLVPGNYSVTITDANGCTGVVTATVGQPAMLLASPVVQTNIACRGTATGSATVSATGGTGSYTYSWAPAGGTAATATGLTAGTYTVTVTDANGCTAIQSFTITQPVSLVSTFVLSQTNITCRGTATGSATVFGVGGTPGYTFSWSPSGDTTSTVIGLTAGTHTVTVTDANGCTATKSITITEPASSLNPTPLSQTNIACRGTATGSATVAVSGGTPGYTYSWSPSGGTAATATGLTAGTYTVTVTDDNGCTATQLFTITQPDSAVSGTTVVTNVSCIGGSNGAINLTPNGGTGPYTYNWGGGITTEDRTGLSVGNYSVTITDANGCTSNVNATVTQPASALSGTTVVTNIACNAASTGAINLTPIGGTGPYTFLWNGGAATEDRTGLSAGNYSVVITDINGCTATVNATVTQPASTVSGNTIVTNLACNGASTGAINITPTGGTGPYTFLWNGGVTTEDRTGLTAGNYSVTITDAYGCTGIVNATITQPASAVSGTRVITNVSCNGGSNGTINLTPTGGTGPYTYNWGGGITTEDRTGLTAGNYSATITDANGCTGVVTATVGQPAMLVTSSSLQTNIACNGTATGAATVTATGGTGAYTYAWAPSGGTSATATGLTAGTYVVTVKDANLCQSTQSFTITQPASTVSGTTILTNIACNGGSTGAINLTPMGGTGPYTYNWGGGITTEDRTGLSAGNYSVTITDANGCTAIVNATVTQPASAVSGTTIVNNIACNGASTGAINLTPMGGTGPYTFLWNGGAATEDRTGLSAGNYSVVITDVNGCTATVNATVTQPASAVSGTTIVNNIACNGASTGAINLTPMGGTGPYTFLWNGGAATEDRTGLSAGNYSVVITDVNGCTATVNATVTQPASALSGTRIITNVSCNGGSNGAINVTAAGGTAPYTYNWGGGVTTEDRTGLVAGNYTVTITDVNGCTATVTATVTQPASALSGTRVITNVSCNGGSNGAINVTAAGGTAPYTYNWGGGITTEDRTGLVAGNYTVTITDVNGCTATVTATVTQPASALSGTRAITNISCNGGSNGAINVTAAGGTPPYTYNWVGGVTTEDRTGLVAGNYTVTITDANGCTAIVNATVTQPASALSGTRVITNVSCNGGSNGAINITAAGGTSPYTYNWGGGITTEDRTGLSAGNYSVVITDVNGCTATVTATVAQPSPLVASAGSQTNIACNGTATGIATVTATGGTGAYSYAWSPSGGTAATASGLAAGMYTVTVTDANMCTATQSFTITQPNALVASAEIQTNVSCNGSTNGAATVAVTNGTGAYTYVWAPSGGTAATASGLAAGTYTVTVTDANMCTATQSFTITQPDALVASAENQTNVSCNGSTNGAATVAVAGGTGAYTYAWSPSGGTTATASGLAAGMYTVTVTDANMCTTTQSFTITEPAAIVINNQLEDETVNTGDNATFTVDASNMADYQWQVSTDGTEWNDVTDGGANPTYSGATTNTLTVTAIPVSFDAYQYRVILSAGVDCETTSAAVVLNVNNILDAVNDDFSAIIINESVGGVAGDVTLNDLYNGVVVADTDITISIADAGGMTDVTIGANGTLTVPASATEGTYTIVYTICDVVNPDNCSTAQVTVVVTPLLGVKEVKALLATVYPNPASTEVFIKLSDAAAHRNAKVTIFDMHGRRVMERPLTTELETINIATLESGVYLFNITSDMGKTTKRIIKNK